jgi:HK97 family phage prohead protease
MEKTFDFSGWATRNNLKCSDGRVIMKDAFKHNDGQTVPLVWNHQHNDPLNVLGHAKLENRDDGVYAYGVFNGTDAGIAAKQLVQHGDVSGLSIYANQLKQQGSNVLHGAIREVSLVLAGANPGAFIDSVILHNAGSGEETEEEAIIYSGENIDISHAVEDVEEAKPEPKAADSKPESEETVQDVFNTLNEKQKTVVYAMLAEAMKHSEENEEEDPDVKHNVFDKEPEETQENVISHSDMMAVIADAKRFGSLKESAISHGITDIDYLFPDAKNLNTPPDFIKREMGWVSEVMGGVHHTPFSRIKSMFADLTEADARAKGYIKGDLKLEEVFGLLKRTTTPTTIYKKQKLDRDDVIDITDFDVVAWLKSEMRMMLDEEIARAVLVGDGRNGASDDKINETNIRPIWTDADLYTIKHPIEVAVGATAAAKAKAIIQEAVRSRINYKGSGNPVFFTTEAELTEMLLLEDLNQRVVYDSVDKLATAMRVRKIVTVPVMENLTRVDGRTTKTLVGLIVNLSDYNIGADKGGAVNMFDDFDIDYNAQKYLIETRCSGALIKPYSAIALEMYEA